MLVADRPGTVPKRHELSSQFFFIIGEEGEKERTNGPAQAVGRPIR